LRIAFTGRGHALALLGAALSAAGAVAGPVYGGQYLAAWGMGLLGFLLAHRALFAARQGSAAGSVERLLLDRPGDGKVFRVGLRVCGGALAGPVEALDEAPEGMEPLGAPGGRAVVPPRGCATIVYRLRGRPGRHRWGAVRLRVRDWLGVLYAEARAVPSGVSEARVPPRAPAWLVEGARRLRESLASAASPVARAASSGVFLGLRDYMPDDDSRLIDWKSSARTGRLLVKVFEPERGGRSLVALDLGAGCWGAPGATIAEAAARTAMGLVEALASAGDEVGLLLLTGVEDAEPTWSGWLRGRRAAARAAAMLSAQRFPPCPRSPGCRRAECPGLPGRERVLPLLGAKRPGLAVAVTTLCGGCSERARELASLLSHAASRLVAVVPLPSPPPGWEKPYAAVDALLAHAARRAGAVPVPEQGGGRQAWLLEAGLAAP